MVDRAMSWLIISAVPVCVDARWQELERAPSPKRSVWWSTFVLRISSGNNAAMMNTLDILASSRGRGSVICAQNFV